MSSKTIVAAPTAADAQGDPESALVPVASSVACGWTRDIEALCRALDAQQRAHFPSTDAEEK